MLWKVLGVQTYPRGRTGPAQGGRSEQALGPTWDDFSIWAEDATPGLSDPETALGSTPSYICLLGWCPSGLGWCKVPEGFS